MIQSQNWSELLKSLGASALQSLQVELQSGLKRVQKGTLDRTSSRGVTRTKKANEDESLNVWGFQDSYFELKEDRSVVLRGQRYELSQVKLEKLVPWIEGVMGIKLSHRDKLPSQYPPNIPPSRLQPEAYTEIRAIFGEERVSLDPIQRLRHGHGHTQEEIYAINYGEGLPRVPDVVVYPESEEEIWQLVKIAKTQDLVVIPYGGGTSVTEALRCPSDEARSIISVDMKRMNRLLWIDPVNRMASIQAGAVGRHVVSMLAEHGFTLGHEPDSIEFSTLGGWIATHASGMKKNKYGNIEDIVLDMNVITSAGIISRKAAYPRISTGIDIRKLMFGSEGKLGIVTSAVVRLSPLPEKQVFSSFIFPCFEDGVNFMYELAQGASFPASARLVDNLQFQFGQALKATPQGHRVLKSDLEKVYVTRLRGFDPQHMVACTLVYEGTSTEVNEQEERVRTIAKKHHGIEGGSENGRRGYQLTFGIAYIRDFIMKHHMIAESFETTVPWSEAIALCERVKRRIRVEHAARKLPGRPFATCRVTQIYPTGACIYFYMAISSKGVANPNQVFAEIEHAAREEILLAGGSLSHHHGIGKIRQHYLPHIMSETNLVLADKISSAWDPDDIFAVRNQSPELENDGALDL